MSSYEFVGAGRAPAPPWAAAPPRPRSPPPPSSHSQPPGAGTLLPAARAPIACCACAAGVHRPGACFAHALLNLSARASPSVRPLLWRTSPPCHALLLRYLHHFPRLSPVILSPTQHCSSGAGGLMQMQRRASCPAPRGRMPSGRVVPRTEVCPPHTAGRAPRGGGGGSPRLHHRASALAPLP